MFDFTVLQKRKALLWIVLLLPLVLVYQQYNPENFAIFPKCPFFSLTGYKCPGCGSQRAIHSLLNLEISKAIRYNGLLVVAIPYILVGWLTENINSPKAELQKWRSFLFGTKAAWIIFWTIILFWIFRNISFYLLF